MNRNVLIPVDLSQASRIALHAAIDVTQPGETTVTVLHVIETLQDVEYEELAAFYAQIRAKAETALAQLTSELESQGYEARAEIVFGRRVSEILRFADERGIDLIVMQSHALDRHHPGERFGTLGHQIALASRCSVLLAR